MGWYTISLACTVDTVKILVGKAASYNKLAVNRAMLQLSDHRIASCRIPT